MRNRAVRALLILGSCLAGACERYRYDIDLNPGPAEMHRALTVQAVRSGDGGGAKVAAEESARLAKLYGAAVKADGAKVSIAGTFKGVMPGDVGGTSTYVTFPTSLGTFYLYSERFRGNDDLLAQWERQVAAIDLLVDLAIAWSRETLKGEDGLETLCAFLDGPMRRDAKNAGLYLRWSGALARSNAGTEESQAEDGKRRVMEGVGALTRYLADRGYIEPRELPVMFASAQGDLTDAPDAAMRAAQRQVLRRMGREGPVPESLAVLSSRDAWAKSIEDFVEKSAEAKRLVEAWNAKRGPRLEQGMRGLLGVAAVDAIGASILPDTDRVAVRLHVPVKPFATNGTWVERDLILSWLGSVEVDAAEASGLPMNAFALWCEADEKEQAGRLGGVRLTGEELASYCLLRHALSEEEGKAWDEFVSTLGGDGAKVKEFRFKGRAAAPMIAEALAAAMQK